MKWNFSFLENKQILKVTVTQQFSLLEQKKMFEEVEVFGKDLDIRRILFDNRKLQMNDVDIEGIKLSVLVVKNYCEKFPDCRIAGLVFTILNFGLGRQFETYSEIEGNMPFQLFRDEQQAIDWLLND